MVAYHKVYCSIPALRVFPRHLKVNLVTRHTNPFRGVCVELFLTRTLCCHGPQIRHQ